MRTRTFEDLYDYCERAVPKRGGGGGSLDLAPYRTAHELYATDGYRLHYLTGLPYAATGFIRDIGDKEPVRYKELLQTFDDAELVTTVKIPRCAHRSLSQLITASTVHGECMIDVIFYEHGLSIDYKPTDRDFYAAVTLRSQWSANIGICVYYDNVNVTGRARLPAQHLIDALVPNTRATFSLGRDDNRLRIKFELHSGFDTVSGPILANALIVLHAKD